MNYGDILVDRVESWCEIQINRPEKYNALREKTAEEILLALAAAEADRDVRAVLIKGNEKSFCAGVDTSEFKLQDGEQFELYLDRKSVLKIPLIFHQTRAFSKPLISVVEGVALGGGFELALLSDMIIAGDRAKFGLPEANLGIMPGGGGTQTLPRIIGKPLAKELAWTGRRLAAKEALEYRIVNHLVEAGSALEKGRDIARSIARSAPLSIMQTKAAIDRGMDMSLPQGMATESDLAFLLHFSRDKREGMAAFAEKRAPIFSGK